MKGTLKKTAVAAAMAGVFGAGAGTASAAGFALIEQSGSGMGNAFAGAAATAEDASTIFFNPAGMSFLNGRQIAVAAHLINLSAEFTDGGTTQTAGSPGTNNGGNAGDLSIVPNMYLSMPVATNLSAGLGINVPFGLKTEYDATWVGRYQGIKSELMTINVNPALSYKVTDTVAIAAGLSYQRLEGELTNAFFTGGPDATAKLEADDDGFGWNVGVMSQITPMTRVGFSYRSSIDYTLEGTSTVTLASGVVASLNDIKADIEVPDSYSLSVAHRLSDTWELLGDLTLTNWSKIQDLEIRRASDGAVLDTLVLRFDDAWRFSFGANYRYSDRLKLRGGVAFDQTPVQDQFRTVRLPDNDRKWLALGARYQLAGAGALDFGYSHLFISEASINNSKTQPGGGFSSTVVGKYEGSVDIFSIQYSMSF